MSNQTQVEAVRSMTNKEMIVSILDLIQKVEELTAKVNELSSTKSKTESVEMTDDHARRVLDGDLKDKKHKDAAEALGLTYGQVYSCRLEFTFKGIHKELAAKGFKNPWKK